MAWNPATEHDSNVDCNALEELVAHPRKFYELVRTIAANVKWENGIPHVEE